MIELGILWKQNLNLLYVCMVNTIYLLSFVETGVNKPRSPSEKRFDGWDLLKNRKTLCRVQQYFTTALLRNRSFYSTSRDQNQPIKLSEFNKVLCNKQLLDEVYCDMKIINVEVRVISRAEGKDDNS